MRLSKGCPYLEKFTGNKHNTTSKESNSCSNENSSTLLFFWNFCLDEFLQSLISVTKIETNQQMRIYNSILRMES